MNENTNSSDLLSRLDKEYAEAWKPEKAGDTLHGFVTDLGLIDSEYGEYPVVTIQNSDGVERAVHAFHETLRNSMLQARPTIGEEIAVRYLGRVSEPKNGGKPYENYRVVTNVEADANGFWAKAASTKAPRATVSDDPNF